MPIVDGVKSFRYKEWIGGVRAVKVEMVEDRGVDVVVEDYGSLTRGRDEDGVACVVGTEIVGKGQEGTLKGGEVWRVVAPANNRKGVVEDVVVKLETVLNTVKRREVGDGQVVEWPLEEIVTLLTSRR